MNETPGKKARDIADAKAGIGPPGRDISIEVARVYATLELADAIREGLSGVVDGLDHVADRIMEASGELRALENLSDAVGGLKLGGEEKA